MNQNKTRDVDMQYTKFFAQENYARKYDIEHEVGKPREKFVDSA
jgi:hypothetical protein